MGEMTANSPTLKEETKYEKWKLYSSTSVMNSPNDDLDSSVKQKTQKHSATCYPIACKDTGEWTTLRKDFSLQMATNLIRDLRHMEG